MKLSYKWLLDYVELDASPVEVARALDRVGFEVESVERIGEGLGDVVVGKVVGVAAHPDADRLRICEVEFGAARPAQVICGAWNFEAGATVAFAPAGASLPGGARLEQRKIRGVVSEGMICSEDELGLGDDAEGIMILDGLGGDIEPGTPLADALGLDDTVIDFDITPNRPDAMSVIGLAREAAAAFGLPLRIPEVQLEESGPTTSERVSVYLDAPDRCPRYTARYVAGVSVGPSPQWMASRLAASGLRPINNVVDVTNFVLLETGQPLHAFDAAELPEGIIRVRMAETGECLVTLDGIERELDSSDLVIADRDRPVALAGIMGGEGSGIGGSTTDVVIESAYFEPTGILRTSKRLGLRTESSARFERGADPEITSWASDRAASLMSELSGGKVGKRMVDEYPKPFERQSIRLRPQRSNAILGTDIGYRDQVRLLASIGLGAETTVGGEASADPEIVVEVPGFRPDLEREIDLIEEVGRLYGYEQITPRLPGGARVGGLSQAQRRRRALAAAARGAGLDEIQTFSFVGPDDLLDPDASVTRVANPLRAEESILRPSLLPGLLKTAALNWSRRAGKPIYLHEFGRVFSGPGESGLPVESSRLGGLIGASEESVAGYFVAKGIVERILASVGVDRAEMVAATRPGLHPGRTAEIRVGVPAVGFVGEAHPEIVRRFGLTGTVSLFELDVDSLVGEIVPPPRFRPYSHFPSNHIDLAFVVDEELPAADLSSTLIDALGDELESIGLFDVYRGEQIGEGKKSLAFTLELASVDHTLSDEEVAALRERAIVAAKANCGARLRA